ncbi:sugar-transfer associated ATP-grasp domain-containing protein [Oceanicoccus sp. KOV_DT_Chl]|uniref:sugar-transfer associated ATP-grasp domain-containing protein n=1 Tax=Oceanicoccus sp. KOV_DT_Chl TaxID=1904639 RepID=UPI000C7B7F5F|nr:sugar-transfer associated ATP-grasp domain-containing protein [Oceanicoccus sp. KOV_DT_Chl]
MLQESHPIIRQLIRFVALPYYYFIEVNWKECDVSRWQVVKDLLYIFFRLNYFPDNYNKCRLWELPREEWVYYYGSLYNPWQRWRLRKEVFPIKYRLLFDDKHICHLLCLACQLPVPMGHGIVEARNFKQRMLEILSDRPDKKLILKPIEGRGGAGILFVSKADEGIVVQAGKEFFPLDSYELTSVAVVQEFLEQHQALAAFSSSVNTIRIVTMMTRSGDVIIIGARLRIGIGGALLDNTSQGGVAVKINMDDGTLVDVAHDNKGRSFYIHPTSNIAFEGFTVPCWQQVVALAEEVQRKLPYNKLLGQDIAVSKDGPVIIELNAEYDNVMFEQACGPLLKNKLVREEFSAYGLLINKYQKNLQ